ncbi:protein containing DUF86, partial [mine drainage metagenome]
SIHVSESFRAAHQDWPWKQMRDTRNHLTHGYAKVDLHVVWDAVLDDLPDLIGKLEAVLGKEPPDAQQSSPDRDQTATARHVPSWRRTPQSEKEGPDRDR